VDAPAVPRRIVRVVPDAAVGFSDARWRTLHGGYEQVALTDGSCRALLCGEPAFPPRYCALFARIRTGAGRSDVCRVAAVFARGGYYADVDTSVRGPLSGLPNASFVTGARLSFEFFGATARHGALRAVLDAQMAAVGAIVNGSRRCVGPHDCVVAVTGPVTFRSALRRAGRARVGCAPAPDRWDCGLVRHWACQTARLPAHRRPCAREHYSRLSGDARAFYALA
jgi:mannosyltransferase OCH1-like enzyme